MKTLLPFTIQEGDGVKKTFRLFAAFILFALQSGSANAQETKTLYQDGLESNKAMAKTATSWSSLSGGGPDGTVYAVAVSAAGDVYVGGFFANAGGGSASNIAKWNGSSWSALGTGVDNGVNAIVVASNGDVYVGGFFTNAGGSPASYIAKWNGSSWSTLGTGMNGVVNAIVINGTDVYVGGDFSTAGGVTANRIAKWNGSNWSALVGGGLNGFGGGAVNSIAISGTYAYIGGDFTNIGISATAANHVERWDITNSLWSSLGSGIDGGGTSTVYAVAASGTDVYVGGVFTSASGTSAKYIAKWDGATWSALGTGMNYIPSPSSTNVTSLSVSAGEVYAGGVFNSAGGVSSTFVAKWDGANWVSLTTALDNQVKAMAYGGGSMYVVGGFTSPYTRVASFTDAPNPLPVEVTPFTTLARGNKVELNWSTATEVNNYGFDIERLQIQNSNFEIRNWSKVGFVAGAGTSTSSHEYSFVDKNVAAGCYAYRIKQINNDGNFKYYGAAEVEVGLAPKEFTLSQNYPNPFNPSTMIQFSLPVKSKVRLVIFNLLGQEVAELANEEVNAGSFQKVWTGGIASGLYFYRLEAISVSDPGKRFVDVKKMVLLK